MVRRGAPRLCLADVTRRRRPPKESQVTLAWPTSCAKPISKCEGKSFERRASSAAKLGPAASSASRMAAA